MILNIVCSGYDSLIDGGMNGDNYNGNSSGKDCSDNSIISKFSICFDIVTYMIKLNFSKKKKKTIF